MHSPEWSPTGKAARQIDARPCWTPLATSMRVDVPEVVGNADRDAVGVECVMIEEVGPELVFVVAAHPDVLPRTILDTTARGPNRPGVMGICGSNMLKIDAAESGYELAVGMDVAVVAPGVDHAGLGGVLTQIRHTPGAAIVEIAAFDFDTEPL